MFWRELASLGHYTMNSELSAEMTLKLYEHWSAVFQHRPEIDLQLLSSPATEKELNQSKLTTCRSDLGCSHSGFTEQFAPSTRSVSLRFEPRTKNLIFVRYDRVK